MERSQSTENTTTQIFAIPSSQTRPASFNPFESSSPDGHRAGPASPTRSRLNSPDPFEDHDIRGWTNLRDDKPGWQSTDFEENLRGYSEGSPPDRFQIERPGQPERETAFRPIPSRQDSRPYQEDFWEGWFLETSFSNSEADKDFSFMGTWLQTWTCCKTRRMGTITVKRKN